MKWTNLERSRARCIFHGVSSATGSANYHTTAGFLFTARKVSEGILPPVRSRKVVSKTSRISAAALSRPSLLTSLVADHSKGGLIAVARVGVANLCLRLRKLGLGEIDDAAESDLVAGLCEFERRIGLVE